MKSYTRYIKNIVFNNIDSNHDNDKQMKAGFPINKILQENNIREQKSLENYGIPLGLVEFNNNKHSLNNIYGGGGGEQKITKDQFDSCISEYDYDKLFELVSYKNKKNKTIKKRI